MTQTGEQQQVPEVSDIPEALEPAEPKVDTEAKPRRKESSWRRGTRVGDFVLRERIGNGTMGVVYRCRHTETGANYALKALPLSAGSYLVKRFKREGEAQAAVDGHPNVVRVRSAGQDAGHVYMVMDLASGGDLETRLRRGPLPPREAALLALALGRGLEHVHARGVLHRDIKPANVLFDAEGVPKLVDFGLALIGEESGSLTKTGDLIGTPIYMAPEQARGKHKDVDERSDVYGLGAVFYHALTGHRPFVGATSLEVVKQVISDPPPKPRSLAPDVPASLEAICLKAMAKDPRGRYASAAELCAALEEFLAGKAQALDPVARAQMRVALLIGGVGGLLLLVAAAVVLPSVFKAPDRTKVAPKATPDGAPAVAAERPDEPAARKRVGWQVRPGAQARCKIVHDVEISYPGGDSGGRWRNSGFTSRMQTDWTWLVREVADGRATIAATLDGVRLHRSSAYGRVDYDSSRDDTSDPMAAALGGTFELDMLTATGQVVAVREVEGIQDAIDRGVRARGLLSRSTLYEVPVFRTAAAMRSELNQLIYVLPGEESGATWTRREPLEDAAEQEWGRHRRGWSMSRILALPPAEGALTLIFTVDPAGEDLDLTWSARTEERRVEGHGRFSEGRLRESTLTVAARIKRSDRGDVRLVNRTRSFTLRGRLDR